MTKLSGKIVRLLALLSLIAALLGPAAPGFAAVTPAQAGADHAAMGCGSEPADHRPAPAPRHMPGALDCCIASLCAMTLALPALPSGVAQPAVRQAARYDLPALIEPAGIASAPIPHPPKTT